MIAQNIKKYPFYCLGLLLLGAVSLSTTTGALPIGLGDIISAKLSNVQETVFYQIRLPRVLLAVLVGCGLAICGAAIQGLFRNPLADAGLLGISSGASLAVALAIVVFPITTSTWGLFSLSFAAFIGCVVTCFVIMSIAYTLKSFSIVYLLLAGIAINALTGSGLGLLTYFSDDQQLRSLTFWTLGSLAGATWQIIFIIITLISPALFLLIKSSRKLNLLLLGEEEAQNLGVNVARTRLMIILNICLITGVCVSFTGIIGFIGLVIPHIIRLLINANHKILLPTSCLLGASVLLIADTIARTVLAPAELPVGILTSLIGAPFFLWLLLSGRK